MRFCTTMRVATRCSARHWNSTRRIVAPRTGYGSGSRRSSMRRCNAPRRSAGKAPVDVLEIGVGERAHRGLETQQSDEVVEVGLREIAPGLEHGLLHVEHVQRGAHADLEPEAIRLVR